MFIKSCKQIYQIVQDFRQSWQETLAMRDRMLRDHKPVMFE